MNCKVTVQVTVEVEVEYISTETALGAMFASAARDAQRKVYNACNAVGKVLGEVQATALVTNEKTIEVAP